jgi:DNA ligase (NAD+)
LNSPDWDGLSKALAPEAPEPRNRTLCISGRLPSGRRKADYEPALKAAGIELVDEVDDRLDYLVLADPASTSSKAQKARQFGVRILSEDELVGLTSGARF